MPTYFDESVHVRGTLSASSFTPPASSVGNSAVISGDPIDAIKLEHQYSIDEELFAPGTTITALTQLLHIARVAEEVVAIEAIITTVASGADRTVTVDLQKSTGGGAFATILTSTVDITNATVIRTPVAGTISGSGSLVDGDILQLVVTVAGAAGAQAEGLLVTTTLRAQPQ